MPEKELASGHGWKLVQETIEGGFTRTSLQLFSEYGVVELSTKGITRTYDELLTIQQTYNRLKEMGPIEMEVK